MCLPCCMASMQISAMPTIVLPDCRPAMTARNFARDPWTGICPTHVPSSRFLDHGWYAILRADGDTAGLFLVAVGNYSSVHSMSTARVTAVAGATGQNRTQP